MLQKMDPVYNVGYLVNNVQQHLILVVIVIQDFIYLMINVLEIVVMDILKIQLI